jgi:hypothetical protein
VENIVYFCYIKTKASSTGKEQSLIQPEIRRLGRIE